MVNRLRDAEGNRWVIKIKSDPHIRETAAKIQKYFKEFLCSVGSMSEKLKKLIDQLEALKVKKKWGWKKVWKWVKIACMVLGTLISAVGAIASLPAVAAPAFVAAGLNVASQIATLGLSIASPMAEKGTKIKLLFWVVDNCNL